MEHRICSDMNCCLVSQNSNISDLGQIPNDCKNDLIHIISAVVVAIALYFASVDERDTVLYFLVFHDIEDLPNC